MGHVFFKTECRSCGYKEKIQQFISVSIFEYTDDFFSNYSIMDITNYIEDRILPCEICENTIYNIFDISYGWGTGFSNLMISENYIKKKMKNQPISDKVIVEYNDKVLSNPTVFLPKLAKLFNTKAYSLFMSQDYKKLELHHNNALIIYLGLVKDAPLVYLPFVADTLTFIAYSHCATSKSMSEDLRITLALRIYKFLNKYTEKNYDDSIYTLIRRIYYKNGLHMVNNVGSCLFLMYKKSLIGATDPSYFDDAVSLKRNYLLAFSLGNAESLECNYDKAIKSYELAYHFYTKYNAKQGQKNSLIDIVLEVLKFHLFLKNIESKYKNKG